MKRYKDILILVTFVILVTLICLQQSGLYGPPSIARISPGDTKTGYEAKKHHIRLAVGILSALSRIDRRNGIRATWFQECKGKEKTVACRFFSDGLPEKTGDREVYVQEGRQNGDIEFMPISAGMNFALRYLWMAKFFSERYDFDFFLRVDDDYFVCLDRLVTELPHRPGPLYWGWYHCPKDDLVRADEGFVILSQDIVLELIDRSSTSLLCGTHAGLSLGYWVRESKLNVTYFVDNQRLVHHLPSDKRDTYLVPEVCRSYLGLHQTYPEYMHKYWNVYNSNKNSLTNGPDYIIPRIPPFESVCKWNGIVPRRGNFKLCKDNPVFGDAKMYKGRGN